MVAFKVANFSDRKECKWRFTPNLCPICRLDPLLPALHVHARAHARSALRVCNTIKIGAVCPRRSPERPLPVLITPPPPRSQSTADQSHSGVPVSARVDPPHRPLSPLGAQGGEWPQPQGQWKPASSICTGPPRAGSDLDPTLGCPVWTPVGDRWPSLMGPSNPHAMAVVEGFLAVPWVAVGEGAAPTWLPKPCAVWCLRPLEAGHTFS